MSTTAFASNRTTDKLILHDGEMGSLIRNYPWQNSNLGPIESWPLSLRTLVNMMLASRFPMLIFWGKELITFYNDAFRPSLGNEGKHPSSLGQRGEESWAESWPVIGPMIYNIMAGGDAVWFEDQKLPIYREGTMGYAYWTYSFSPVTDDRGETNGILVTCTETTKAVEAIESLGRSEGKFKNLVRETSTGIAVMMGPEFRIEIVNEAFAQLVGRTVEELLGKNEFEVIPEAEAEFRPLMEQALQQNEPIYLNNTPYTVFGSEGEKIEGVVNITYQPYKETNGEVTGLIVLCQDVTIQQKAQQQIRESEARFRDLIEQAPVASCLFVGRELKIEVANNLMLDIWGKGKNILGKPLVEALPELEGQPFLQILDDVFTTGNAYAANGARADLTVDGRLQTFYFDFTYKPVFDAQGQVYGVIDMAIDVTEQVLAQQAIESSQQDLLALFEQSPVAIATISKDDLTFRMVNPFYAELVGRTPERLINKPLLEALPEIAGQGFDDLLQGVIKNGVPFMAKEAAVKIIRNGKLETIYVDLTYQPRTETKDGEVAGVLVVAADVTEQVYARKKIEQAEENLRMAIDAAALATFSIDIENRKLQASPRLKEFFGYGTDEEMPYEAALGQVREDYRQQVSDAIEAAIMSGVSYDTEHPIIRTNAGETRWVRAVGTVQTRNDGNNYLIGILNDITEKKLDEIRKNDFIGMVSHELKTPLTSMSGYLQFLQAKATKNGDTFTTGILQKANKQIGKMTTMINGFLNVSRLESGKIHMDKTRFDMAGLMKEAEEEIRASVLSHEMIFEPVEETWVFADRDKIGHVINNFISNAVKYSPARSIVQIACVTIDGKARVSVNDKGIGISPEDVPKLFDRYYRVGGDSTISGFGIGLYLCKEIIDRHNGTIQVESEPGKGSTFYFTLPVIE